MTPDARRRERLHAALGPGGPIVVARAPGRVNLIGEHTDYNGLPVLPMALSRSILVAGRAAVDGRITVANLDAAFAAASFALRAAIPPAAAGDWTNYVRAAAQEVAPDVIGRIGGARLVVGGDVPLAAGVSSSSALVVATALALHALAGVRVPAASLADRLARAERYVGTLSGGMDQAAILLGEAGRALRIDFFPLRARPVPLPPDLAVVVAHSLEDAPKAGAARGGYNQRVVECRVACALLARRLGVVAERLGDLPDRDGVLRELPQLLPETIEREALARLLGSHAAVALVPPEVTLAEPGRFVLRARARHALSEAARVDRAEEALAANDLAALGGLLDESHRSCAGDFAVSTPALDALVAAARAGGAAGARLMGAGFGGSAVAVVDAARAADLIAHLDATYYAPRGAAATACFTARSGPAASATVEA